MDDAGKKTFGQFISYGSAKAVARDNAASALAGSSAPLSGIGRDEKAALRRAEEAEQAFRASKGYPPNTLRGWLKANLFHKK